MKKALIDQIMLGFFIFATLIVLGATVADNMKAKAEIEKLRTVVQNAALASAKYYSYEDSNTSDAQTNANDLIAKTKIGQSVKDRLVYTWDLINDPNSVTVKIENYQVDYFWYKFLGEDKTSAFSLEAKAEIAPDNSDPRCICGETAGVGLIGRTLCVVGTDTEEQVQIASDGNQWKVKTVFDNGAWEEEEWYAQNAVDEVIVITFNGNDQIQLNDLNLSVLVDGGCGDDQIQGSTGDDTIYGNEGDDQIEGKEGNDIIYGGNGDDQLQGGNGNDTMYTDGNDSTVDGGSGSDTTDNALGYSDDCNGTVKFECGKDSVILVY